MGMQDVQNTQDTDLPLVQLARPSRVAEALDVSRSKVYEMIHDGTIPAVRIGGQLRVPVPWLRTWIAEQAAGRR